MNNNNNNPNRGTTLLPPQGPAGSMYTQQPSFFLGAPITKLLCMFWVVGYLLVVRKQQHAHSNGLPLSSSTATGGSGGSHSNRFTSGDPLSITSLLLFQSNRWFFSSAFELVAGTGFLAQYLRRLERELSSRRFIAWLCYVSGFYALTQVFTLMTLGDDAVNAYVLDTPAKGPYALIGASTYWYAMYVPRLYPRFISIFGGPSSNSSSSTSATTTTSSSTSSSSSSSTNSQHDSDDNNSTGTGTGSTTNGGICLSEKAFGYGWSMFLLWKKGPITSIVGVVGMAASAFFFSVLPKSMMDIPDVVVKTLPWDTLGGLLFLETNSKIFAPLLVASNGIVGGIGRRQAQAGRQRRPDGPTGGTRRSGQHAVAAAAAAAAAAASGQPPIPNPSPEAIATLTSMGFDEARVKEALQVTNNNVERAADILLAG